MTGQHPSVPSAVHSMAAASYLGRRAGSMDKLVGSLLASADVPLLHRAFLNWKTEPDHKRKTSIIATIGPKTNSVDAMVKLREAGMNIVRQELFLGFKVDFSHGSYEYHASVIKNVRDSFISTPGRPVAIALDTKGPEIRTGMVENDGSIPFTAGHVFKFTTDDSYAKIGNKDIVYIDYPKLPQVMAVGKSIYIDDGTLSFKVIQVGDNYVMGEARNAGTLLSKKGVNLPQTDIDLPSVSEKDKQDIQFAVDQGLDMIFASFIRSPRDIDTIRSLLGEKGKHIKIFAKIENHQGLDHFDAILKAADGIMVARGDLGTEIPSWKVFVAQKSIIAKCNIAGKSVICATQMMQSMTASPRPTRAEASDVANAVLDGADCVMLSAETASGQYPYEAVSTMSRICQEAEATLTHVPFFNELRSITPRPLDTTETIAVACVNASLEEDAKAILCLTTSGNTARLIAKYRPLAPILAVTKTDEIARQMHMYRGCYPFVYRSQVDYPSDAIPSHKSTPTGSKSLELFQGDVDARIQYVIKEAMAMGLIQSGDVIIAVQGWRPGSGQTNCLRILEVP